ncbi:lysophospholipid acyltransferase family protein [Pseudoruegeria sp. HB172150]|uniref:lysophospholipid acyltransferase family protein n=1 Tax=Pseudoruegeria sp. HB172150 TaxID=2721164 RepID=UPI00155409D2|nr:lysophospholipid acyltransferase family protein [Pseudoruegeria sp. HB172150]
MKRDTPTFSDRVSNAAIRGFIGLALLLPYRWRVPAFGWVVSRIAAPIAGWDKRVRDNLALIFPDMDPAEVRQMTRKVPDNFGRSLIEIYSGAAFRDRIKDIPFTGDGVAALEEAKAKNRPVILITGHFGNYDVPRTALVARGYPVGGLYNPMSNPLFNAHYVRAMETLGEPMFERSRRGLAQMVKFLRGGGMVGMVVDHYMKHGVPLEFLGQPAWTALSAAEMAVKYDALAIPIYGIREPDGLNFRIVVEPPIPHGDPQTMTQAMNDSLARLIEDHVDQWFWIHRRWKEPRNRG